MSDYYLCEHKHQCCGTCIRATKTEVTRLESERDTLKLNCESLAKAHARVTQDRDHWRSMAKRLAEALKECDAWVDKVERLEKILSAYDAMKKGEK